MITVAKAKARPRIDPDTWPTLDFERLNAPPPARSGDASAIRYVKRHVDGDVERVDEPALIGSLMETWPAFLPGARAWRIEGLTQRIGDVLICVGPLRRF